MQVRQRDEVWYHRFSSFVLGLAIAATILFFWRRVTPMVAMLASLSGCVLSPGLPVAATLPPGDYWVEPRAEELAAFALPGTPQDATWATAGERDAAWFAGEGVYRLDPDVQWTAISVADEQRLDDVLQTWDAQR